MSSFSVIELEPIPFQRIQFNHQDDDYYVEIRQLGEWLYTSTEVNGEVVTHNIRATNEGRLVPYPNANVKTVVHWIDVMGDQDPQYEGLGTRWFLELEE